MTLSIAELLTRECEITSRRSSGTVDELGDEVPDENTVTTICELQQKRRDEPDAAGEVSDTYWDLFLPAGTVLRTADQITVDGEDYEMVGDPWHVADPDRDGAESHVQATLRRVAGSDDEVGS